MAGIVQGKPAFPAIAVPVERKDLFECPQGMLDELICYLPKISKILIVGWRATEDHFISLVGQHLTPGIRLYTVAGTHMEAVNINKRIEAALSKNTPRSEADPDPTGFQISSCTAESSSCCRLTIQCDSVIGKFVLGRANRTPAKPTVHRWHSVVTWM